MEFLYVCDASAAAAVVPAALAGRRASEHGTFA